MSGRQRPPRGHTGARRPRWRGQGQWRQRRRQRLRRRQRRRRRLGGGGRSRHSPRRRRFQCLRAAPRRNSLPAATGDRDGGRAGIGGRGGGEGRAMRRIPICAVQSGRRGQRRCRCRRRGCSSRRRHTCGAGRGGRACDGCGTRAGGSAVWRRDRHFTPLVVLVSILVERAACPRRPAGDPNPAHWLSNSVWRPNIQDVFIWARPSTDRQLGSNDWSAAEHVSDTREPPTARLRPDSPRGLRLCSGR